MSPTIMSGRQARLQQRVGGAVDGDDHGPPVADERAQRAQVALVADAAHDHQRRAVAEVGGEARHLDPAGEQLALLAHVLDRVVREALERLADLAPAGLRLGAHALAGRAPRRAPAARLCAAPARAASARRLAQRAGG